LKTRRWNGTKSAFADYAASPAWKAGNRACLVSQVLLYLAIKRAG
jgi:hypothetical protein